MTPTETNILLAEFCGWTLNKGAEPHPAFPDDDPRRYWTSPTGEQKRLMGLLFATDYNFFVLVWNKAVTELEDHCLPSNMGRTIDGADLLLHISIHNKLSFTIETRLPILIETIKWLNNNKDK